MQQRQLRLGDILDDYCPRERRLTNHAVVAMIGDDVKQTRCATCETEHEYKHAKVPRQRRKADAPAALYAQVLASGPKRVAHDGAHATAADDSHRDAPADEPEDAEVTEVAAVAELADVREVAQPSAAPEALADTAADRKSETDADASDDEDSAREDEEGPVHRPLIRASLPKHEGQAPPSRPIPEFTIRQPGGRPNRFRPRGTGGGGGGQFGGGGNRGNGNMPGGPRGGGMRSGGGRPPQGGGGMPSRMSRRQGPPGRKRSK
jgi:hypothetical protein